MTTHTVIHYLCTIPYSPLTNGYLTITINTKKPKNDFDDFDVQIKG